jgi:hypothetical protein
LIYAAKTIQNATHAHRRFVEKMCFRLNVDICRKNFLKFDVCSKNLVKFDVCSKNVSKFDVCSKNLNEI